MFVSNICWVRWQIFCNWMSTGIIVIEFNTIHTLEMTECAFLLKLILWHFIRWVFWHPLLSVAAIPKEFYNLFCTVILKKPLNIIKKHLFQISIIRDSQLWYTYKNVTFFRLDEIQTLWILHTFGKTEIKLVNTK